MQLPREAREALAEIFTLQLRKGLGAGAALRKQLSPHP